MKYFFILLFVQLGSCGGYMAKNNADSKPVDLAGAISFSATLTGFLCALVALVFLINLLKQ